MWIVLRQWFLVGPGMFCVVVGGSHRWFARICNALGSWATLEKRRNRGELGFCNDLRLILPHFSFSLICTRCSSLKEKTGDLFPQMYVPSPCLFPLWNANILLKRLSIMPNHHELARSSDLCPGIWKNEFVRGRRWGSKECVFICSKQQSWGTLSSCQFPWALCSQSQRAWRMGELKKPMLLICQLGWGFLILRYCS